MQCFLHSVRQTNAEWKAELRPCWQTVPAARAAELLLPARCDGAPGLAGLPAAQFSSNWGLASGSSGTPGSNKLWVESALLSFWSFLLWKFEFRRPGLECGVRGLGEGWAVCSSGMEWGCLEILLHASSSCVSKADVVALYFHSTW